MRMPFGSLQVVRPREFQTWSDTLCRNEQNFPAGGVVRLAASHQALASGWRRCTAGHDRSIVHATPVQRTRLERLGITALPR